MGDVIHVDFIRAESLVNTINDNTSKINEYDNPWDEFLEECKTKLDSEDYVNLLEAIASPRFYREFDDEIIKDLADVYFELTFETN